MPWRVGIVAVSVTWLFLAGPAVAGIQRHTDSKGVIHIGNVPSKPAPVPHPATAPEAMAALPEPAVAQVSQPTPSSTEPDIDAIAKACEGLVQHEFDGIAAAVQAAAEPEVAEASKAAEPAEAAVDYNYLPLKKVSHEPDVIPALAPKPAPPKPETVTAGGIRRYRDAQGVIHITNGAPEGKGLTPAVQLAARPVTPGNRAVERSPSRPAATEAPLQVRQAAWNPDEAELANLPVKPAPVKKIAAATTNGIRHYRDSKGVIRIENVAPERETVPASTLQARRVPEEGIEAPGLQQAQRQFDLEGAWVLRPAAWDGEEGLKLVKRAKAPASKAASPKKVEITSEGGIRRYRDKQGVVHIKTVEHPLPPGVVLASHRGGPKLTPPAVVSAPAPALPAPAALSNPAPPANSAVIGSAARVTAFRDAKGRLRITTEMPQLDPGKNPPPTVASAELEPIIQEAAQIHRLPATLIRAVIKVESNFCSWAVSPKGAMGCMQLMPGTANLLGVQEPFNPRQNILGGSRYLRDLINLFGGNVPLALAAYNAGFQRVINCGYQIPSIKETQDFVAQVMGRYVADEKRARQPVT